MMQITQSFKDRVIELYYNGGFTAKEIAQKLTSPDKSIDDVHKAVIDILEEDYELLVKKSLKFIEKINSGLPYENLL